MEAMGLGGTAKHKLAILAEETNGIYSPTEHKGLPKEAPKERGTERRPSARGRPSPYLFLYDPVLTRENHDSSEKAGSW